VKPAKLIDSLKRFSDVLAALVRTIPLEDARWRPADGAWSVLEVLRHLLDEEVEDFRGRLERTLRDPTEPWAQNDPEGWALERRYNEADPAETVERFVAERRESVVWLRSVSDADWSQAHEHPQWGPIRAGDILVSWAAHDALHLRQIAKRMFQLAQRDGGKYQTAYAGEWKA
jgi:hypothetical protein